MGWTAVRRAEAEAGLAALCVGGGRGEAQSLWWQPSVQTTNLLVSRQRRNHFGAQLAARKRFGEFASVLPGVWLGRPGARVCPPEWAGLGVVGVPLPRGPAYLSTSSTGKNPPCLQYFMQYW
jgi:hypothetical protein